jgi:hypothetical protein
MTVRRRGEREQLLVVRALLLALDDELAPQAMAAELAATAKGNEVALARALARLQPRGVGGSSPVTQRARGALLMAMDMFTAPPAVN